MNGLSVFSNEDGWEKYSSNPKILFSNQNIVATLTSSYQYPFSLKRLDDNILMILEGKVYDRSASVLFKDIEKILSADLEIERYLFHVDGEFYLNIINLKTNTLKVFGDHLNRLPLYFGNKNGKWIVSRDIAFVQRFLNATINKIHLAEFLIFDYNLANHTLFSGVSHLQISERLISDISTGETNVIKKKYTYDFSEKPIIELDKDTLEKMVSTFLDSSKCRASTKNILSLSGGMDSRSVAAGLDKVGKKVTGVTFEDEEKSATNDVVIAQEIAESLDMEWKKIDLTTESFLKDVNETIRFKIGSQPARFYFLNQYCRKVCDIFGDEITFFTGDGGDKVFPDLTNGIDYHDDQKLLELILKENHEFSILEAAKLTGINHKKLASHIMETISNFPGKTSGEKHEYFLLTCRMKRYIFEGEDRNRRFFWSTTPFLSKPFFALMIKINYEIKKEDGFYLNFIYQLNEQVALIRDENYATGEISVSKGFYNFVKDKANSFLSRKNKEQLKSIFKGRKPSKTIELYKNLISEFQEEDHPIDPDLVRKNINQFSLGQLSLIITTIMVSNIVDNTNYK